MVKTTALPCLLPFVLILNLASLCQAENESTWTEPPFNEFAKQLNALLEKHYPKVREDRSKVDEGILSWEYDTRKFMVHVPDLRGDWQKAQELTGPNRKGIMCWAQIREGRYMEMAALPQTFERFYFKILMLAPYRKDVDSHLIVQLSYPPGVDPKLLAEFNKTVQEFGAQDVSR